jgi:hypothetical protein
MKKTLMTIVGIVGLTAVSEAQFAGINGGIMLGGGFMEDPDKGYGFLQLRGTFYEDDAVSHTLSVEFLRHSDDAELEFLDLAGVPYYENGEISFTNFTLNYELEAKLSGAISFYAGVGGGIERVSLDDAFDFSVDSDRNFVGQAFAGFRTKLGESFFAQFGIRHLWREDFALLTDQFVVEDTTAYDLSIGFRF